VRKINLFGFIVKNFGFLKFVPLLALVFDAWLKLWSLISNPEILDAMDEVETAVCKWPGASVGLHKYGDVQFNYDGRELGHIHGNGLLDIRFSRAVKYELLKEQRVNDHHIFKNSGWISFYISNKEDSAYAIRLLEMVYQKCQGLENAD
jgi:hypothetical protein